MLMDALSCSSSSDESSDVLSNVEGVAVPSDRRGRFIKLKKIRRDDLKESFDALIHVCPGLKGMNPVPSRGKVLTKAADLIKNWSKDFDLSKEGLKAFQENSKYMNDFRKEMENVERTGTMTEAYRQMKEHIEKNKAQFAMFTQEQYVPAELCEGLNMDEIMEILSHQGEHLYDGDVDSGEDDVGDDENSNENDKDSYEEDSQVEYFDIGAEEVII
ncbi:uncharacterized protein LOC135938400 [Cloeon dipterum]|uniref:uncharacterized protein LOC135938400 n=1 Tax=Cloeon dipterum TaxID=197152 RepID=UPI00321FCE10